MEQNLVIKWYKSIDSTNTQAMKEAYESPEGSVWFAEYQTNGRGQRGNKWESVKGQNLTFSLLLKPNFLNAAEQFAISETVSVGICKYLNKKGLQPKIKWPNDIYINNKKICGILIENTISGANLAVSICGVGLNLSQTQFSSDAPNPTSLALELCNTCNLDLKEELSLLISEILLIYNNLKDTNEYANQLHKEYISLLYRYNQIHKFVEITQQNNLNLPVEKIDNGRVIEGEIIDVNTNGCVVIKVYNPKEAPQIKSYSFKEIRFII